MRKVRVFDFDDYGTRYEYYGLLHQFTDNGRAIVELNDGTARYPNASQVTFIEPPHREIQSRIDRLVIKVEQLHEHGNIGSMAHSELMDMLDEMKDAPTDAGTSGEQG